MAAPLSHTPESESEAASPSKLSLSHFVYKPFIVTIFLVLVPLFPSLAPDFFNQTLHARSWELLQLIFVGIAVSYGLFSRKNEEPLKDHNSTPPNPQSYLSKLLQASSVFDDESESVIEDNNTNTNINSSQYYRGQPPVIVVPKQENGGVVSEIAQKPLLLPVRSLKQRLPSPNDCEPTVSRIGGLNLNAGENAVVLRSPIPWRSRSGRMEAEVNGDRSEQLSNRIESRSVRPKNLSPSPSIRKLSPSTSESPVRKKSLTPPPPPPPPPPQTLRKSVLMKSNSSIADSREKEEALRRSLSSVAEPRTGRTFRSSDQFVRKESIDYGKEEEKNEVIEKVVVETSDDEEEIDDEDDFMELEGRSSSVADVDKKADEFIAKFREQIRLQRIESIRKSTALRSTGNKLASK